VAVNALRGALGFLTRIPITPDDADWDAFRAAPWTFPVVGYVVGLLASMPVFAPLPDGATAASYVAVLYLVTGVSHADGLADLGDAAAVHGPARRREVLKDSMLGVGGALALGVVLVALAFTAASAVELGVYTAVALFVASEVGAKLGMAVLACTGTAAHEGIGSQFTGNEPRDLVLPVFLTLPLLVVGPPAIAVLGGPIAAVVLARWTRGWLGGVNGDVFGATNELGRFLGLLLGVMAWTVW